MTWVHAGWRVRHLAESVPILSAACLIREVMNFLALKPPWTCPRQADRVAPSLASTAPTPVRPSDRVRSSPRAAELLHSPPPCATGLALSIDLAMADATHPPAPSSPCPSVLWRPVEPRGMPGAVPYQARYSETCYVDAPFPTKKSVPLGFLIRCTS